MKRADIYITEEQYNKLEELKGLGQSKSFFIRKGLDLLFISEYFKNLIKSLKEKI